MHTGSRWISKSSELTLKFFVRSSKNFPKLPNQDFVEPPFEEEMVPFIKELGYTSNCDMLSEIYTYHMHQPWRTFAAIINRCISRKSTGLDRLKPLRAQIEIQEPATPSKKQTLVLEDEPAKKPKRAEKSLHAKEDVSFKKPSRKKSTSVVIKNTPGMFVSKKKVQAKVHRGNGMDLLSDVALLVAAHLKKVLKKSKQDTHMLHAIRTDDRVGYQLKVLDELQDKTTGTNEGTGTIPGVPDVPKDLSESENESWGNSKDEDDTDDDNDDDSDDDGNNVDDDDNP
ncbi:hypothetical protein Tco_0188964 [Tanacetum coccineum]